jgi:hypothetical protein
MTDVLRILQRAWVEPWAELRVDRELLPADAGTVPAILTMNGRGREAGPALEAG